MGYSIIITTIQEIEGLMSDACILLYVSKGVAVRLLVCSAKKLATKGGGGAATHAG